MKSKSKNCHKIQFVQQLVDPCFVSYRDTVVNSNRVHCKDMWISTYFYFSYNADWETEQEWLSLYLHIITQVLNASDVIQFCDDRQFQMNVVVWNESVSDETLRLYYNEIQRSEKIQITAKGHRCFSSFLFSWEKIEKKYQLNSLFT